MRLRKGRAAPLRGLRAFAGEGDAQDGFRLDGLPGVIAPMNASRLRVLSILLAALAVSAAGARAEDVKPSQAACDARKIGARDLADCLRSAADRADRDLAAEVEAALKSVDARAGVMSAQKSRWKRSLNESEEQWLSWREVECQDVAPFEAGMNAKGGDPRLACIIDRDAERVADLKARYP